ncbi:MAG: 2OG-Fe(II) oxygenase family protein [Bdellovibrionota bacterium]
MYIEAVDYRDKNAKEKLVQSILTKGFGVLKNHPISASLIESAHQEWVKYFSSEEKHRDTFDPKIQAGYFPFKSENAKGHPQKDLKEFFHYYDWHPVPTIASTYTPKLRHELIDVAQTLLSWIEDQSPSEVKENFSEPLQNFIKDSDQTLLRPIHYPPFSGEEEQGAVRAAAHEDINLITILPAASAPGLEVKDLEGRWHQVSCDPGMLVVNSGDMLQEASGGYFPSTTHRVVNPSGELAKTSRYSMPLFLHPRSNVKLSEKHTAGSYLHERLKELGLMS